jgi:hypothetical protein
MWYKYTMKHYSSIKKNEIASFFKKLDETRDHDVE